MEEKVTTENALCTERRMNATAAGTREGERERRRVRGERDIVRGEGKEKGKREEGGEGEGARNTKCHKKEESTPVVSEGNFLEVATAGRTLGDLYLYGNITIRS